MSTTYQPHPVRRAQYYPMFRRLSYYVTDQAKVTAHDITEEQARAKLHDLATGHKELVQVLEIIPNNKI